mmetsp:Transcript_36110/g.84635  ORF Transcript_36110/g.84635 Transcript_36110/m.84635 type:complete len:130 (-) Transcript_36110:160-549(-)
MDSISLGCTPKRQVSFGGEQVVEYVSSASISLTSEGGISDSGTDEEEVKTHNGSHSEQQSVASKAVAEPEPADDVDEEEEETRKLHESMDRADLRRRRRSVSGHCLAREVTLDLSISSSLIGQRRRFTV